MVSAIAAFWDAHWKEVLAPSLTLMLGLVDRLLRATPRVRYGTAFGFTFRTPGGTDAEGREIRPVLVHTRSLFITNVGRAPAKRVELTFNWRPWCMNFWPPLKFDGTETHDGRYVVTFESLAPKQWMRCEILNYTGEPPELLHAKSEEAEAKPMNMAPQPVFPKPLRALLLAVFFLGVCTAFYGFLYILAAISAHI